jgi:monovalent cation:proton antiporter-2 (CPA2) family protein
VNNEDFFAQAFIYLLAAVLSVPIAKRLGLGSVLGYLLAGVIIGPFGLKFVGQEGSDVMHFAEFGVVMMLFLVGLELQPTLLWRLRLPILGLGGLQVVVTTAVIGAIALLAGVPWQMAVTVGMILSMSSTAIVLQTLKEKGLMKTEAGQSSFSVLLFQDIAVIPMLAILPLLAIAPHSPVSLVASNGVFFMAEQAAEQGPGLPAWQQALLVIGLVAGIIVVGRFLTQPIFRFIADTQIREVFTATALLLVVGIALAMQAVGLSPALGTFLAGVVLAENEYRHELETDIEPFKGLLLGLFFIAVGASINFTLLFQQPLLVAGLVVGLAIAKFLVLFGLGRFFRLDLSQNLLFAFALAQGGEFAFVLFSFATQNQVLTSDVTGLLVAVVALSMMLTPLIMIVNDKVVQPRFMRMEDERETDNIDDNENPVIIAGFGRFGQIVGRLLLANGCKATVLDHNAGQIDMLRRFGFKVFYGDASRIDLLRAAGAEQAKLLVIAIDDPEKTLETVDLAHKYFPHLKILARSIDRSHTYELIRRGVEVVKRETFSSALEMGTEALTLLGVRAYKANRIARTFRQHDEQVLHEIANLDDDDETVLIARSRQLAEELGNLLKSDDREFSNDSDRAWDISELRKDAYSRE